MIEWRLTSSTFSDRWNVSEYDDRGAWRRHIVTGIDKATARRIARLPELESRLVEADACIDELYDGSDQDECDRRTAAYYTKYPPKEDVTP